MTNDKQPEALRLANALEYCDASVARQAINELRLQYAELETLRAGYAAARLEIETLKAQQPGAVYAELPEPHHRGPAGAGNYFSSFTADQMRAFADATCALRVSHWQAPAQPAPQQEPSCTSVQLAEMVLSDCGHSSNYTPLLDRVAARIDAHVERCLDELRGCLESNPAPSPAAQGDAARYRFLRDGEWRDTDLEPFIRLQLNTLWDAKIDAARAAQEGKSNDR